MSCFRHRVLEAGPDSYLGIVDGFPEILVQAVPAQKGQADLVRGLEDYLERIQKCEDARIKHESFPTVRVAWAYLRSPPE
jgi:hypothetical protein